MARDMVHDTDSSPTARLLSLWDHLGIRVAHVATQMPGDIAGLAARFASRLGGVVLCVPSRLDPPRFEAAADRLLMICGERGLTADVTARAAARLRGATRVVLAGYDAPGWADVVADRTDEIAREMSGFLGRLNADAPASTSREGTHAGISYRVVGSGPALVLLPFFLAPSQWAPAVAQLARTFTVVTLGGAHLGGVAALEDRARAPTYQAMFRTLIDLMAPAPGEAILDVGCGAGSLDRLLAQWLGPASAITAIDVNPFLLSEAAFLARAEGFDGRIRFAPGNAEALPFADESFDCIFSITVLRSATPTARWPRWCAWRGRAAGWASSCDRSTCRNGGVSSSPTRFWTGWRLRRNRSAQRGWPTPAFIAAPGGPGSPISPAFRPW